MSTVLTFQIKWQCWWINLLCLLTFKKGADRPCMYKPLSCRKCTKVASAHVCVCNQTVPEYIVLLRYFFTAAEKISKFETCGLTVSVVWSCSWHNRFNVTGQFTEKKLVQDKSSPLAHKNLRELYERCLKVLTYICGWCSGDFCPTELPYKKCLFLYVQEISTQLTFKLWCVSYREIVGLGVNSLISRKDMI